jgi:hypothetical protein
MEEINYDGMEKAAAKLYTLRDACWAAGFGDYSVSNSFFEGAGDIIKEALDEFEEVLVRRPRK